jgi:site-specific DNA-methyltransferase (adenine-specific)
MSYLTYDHAGRADKEGRRRIFSTMEILPPGTVCTETYLVIDCFDSEIEAQNLLTYLKTKFIRFLVAQVTTTQHISKANFSLVPIQDFSKPWTDAELYAKYGLTEDEIAFIEATIKPME